MTAVAAIKAAIDAAESPWETGFRVFDGEPIERDKPYACIYDQSGGAERFKADGRSRIRYPFQVTCVARTRDGLRLMTQLVRGALLDLSIDGSTPITEDGSVPINREGEGTDIRYVAPLLFHCYLP